MRAKGVLPRQQQPAICQRAGQLVVRRGVVLPGGGAGDRSGAIAMDTGMHNCVFFGE